MEEIDNLMAPGIMEPVPKIGQIYSLTENPMSLFMLLAKAVLAYDVKGAFLNSVITDDIYVHVRVDQELSNLPYSQTYAKSNGTLRTPEDIIMASKKVHWPGTRSSKNCTK